MIKRSPIIGVATVQGGDGCTHIEITIDRSPYKSIKLDHLVTIYEAMAVAAVELKLTEAIKSENN